MPELRVGIIGARGFTGRELLRILSRHTRIGVAFITSRELAGRRVKDEAPECGSDLVFEDLSPEACAARDVDAFVLALPNGASDPYVAAIDAARPEARAVDLSADRRFDPAWVYGQPERNRERIGGARRVANPGCYATAFQLAAAPLLPFVTGPLRGFGVSGYSGAGTTPSPRNDPDNLEGSVLPYALVDHTHEREVGAHLGHPVRFLPHVAPFFRGLSVTVSADLASSTDASALLDAVRLSYRDERLVRVTDDAPTAKVARDRHEVFVGGLQVSRDGTHVAVVGALDNLLGGAATTAVRNLNLSLGLPELLGVSAWLR